MWPPSGWVLPTFLSRVDGGHGAERTLSHVVVNPDLDLVRGKRRDALVLEDVSGGVGRRDGGLHPTRSPKWAEGHHVAEARAALQLLGNRLRREERGGGVTQSGWLNTILQILIPERNVVVRRLAMWERQWGLLLPKRNYRSKLDGCKYQTAQNSELIRASGGSPSIINYIRVWCRDQYDRCYFILCCHRCRKTNHSAAGENKFTSQVMTSSERPPPPPFTLAGATRGAGEIEHERFNINASGI